MNGESSFTGEVYLIVFMHGIFFKVKEDGRCVSKYIYKVLGIDQRGKKEVLVFMLLKMKDLISGWMY